MTQGFNDNLYLIDLSYLKTPAEVVYDLSSILDTEPAKNQRVKLKLGNVEFNKSQLLSIKSLIESINSTLTIVDGKSEITRNSAIAIGLVYQNSSDMVPETVFNDSNKIADSQKSVVEEVKPELFPDVSPVKLESENSDENNHQQEKTFTENSNEENKTQEQNQQNINFQNGFDTKKVDYGYSETIEIQPPKFETSEENLNFEEDNKKEWFNTEETPKVQSLEEGFANNNWAKPENTENNDLIINTDITIRENKDETLDFDDTSGVNHRETFEEEKSGNTENVGIQSLADIPLDIPNDKTIQEELSVIYNTERKLDDVFEKTGLKEEKFKSIKETAHAEEREYTQYDFEIEAFPTKYLKQTICAGQFISFDGNLVIIGDCHEGSEISASGDVTVWGDLSGSVHAGKNGNEKCKIRALHLNASQLRIANCYIKRPVALNTQQQPSDAAPEEAMISKGEIVVYKIYK